MMMAALPQNLPASEIYYSAGDAAAGHDLALSGLKKILPGFYQVVNNTAVLIQELQRETSLNADELLTLATIATANLQRWHRTTSWKGDSVVAISLVPASQSALARATGTPRQTMRRRLDKLAAMGAVHSVADGVVIDFNSPIILALLRHLQGASSHSQSSTANAA